MAIVMCDGGGASQALPWQSELGTALPLSGPDAGAAAGDDPAVTGAAAGCAVEFGLAACAFAIAGANAPKNSAAASARFFKIMAQM